MGIYQGDGGTIGVAPYVSVGCSGAIDGVLQPETLNNGIGTHVEQQSDTVGYLAIAHRHMACAIGVHI